MSKITLNNVASFTNDSSAVSTVNNNSSTIQEAFDNTLSRDGTSPNQMEAPLDMNSNPIINLPNPISLQSPLRLTDLNTFIGGGTIEAIPAGGLTGQSLTKHSNTDYDVEWAGTPAAVNIDTIAALRATSSGTNSRAIVFGYYAVGDCRPRTYYYDPTDTTSTDNGGTIIVASDNGRWKLIDNTILTAKTFGAKTDGTDQSATLVKAITYAAANGVALVFDGIFSVNSVVLTGLNGVYLKGDGGLLGIATTSTDSILQFINCIDVEIDSRFTINGNYNTNYTYGFHAGTTTSGQNCQLYDLEDVIIVGCKTAFAFGNASRPNDDVSDINIRGGYIFGCPQYLKAIGTETVVQVAGVNADSSYGNGNTSWQTLPNYLYEAQGATLMVTGGEATCTALTTNALFLVSALAGTTTQYGNINISNVLMEVANCLCFTNTNGTTSPTAGAFTMTGCNFVATSNIGSFIQLDSSFQGTVTLAGNRGFASVNRSSSFNVTTTSATSKIYFDLATFGLNFPQGYNGINGGLQYLTSKDITQGVVYTATTVTQSFADSDIIFTPTANQTVTLLSPTIYPGRMLFLSNNTNFSVTSASTNIVYPSGGQGATIFPTNAIGGWMILVSDVSGGNNWRVVAFSYGSPIRTINTHYYTSSTTYTVPSNLSYAIIECQASGGGGGGVAGVASTSLSAGGGGGGGYAKVLKTGVSLGSSVTVTVGAGGAGGAAGNNAGSAGNVTSFGSFCAAAGGQGGVATSGTSAVGGGCLGGTGTTGDILIAGGSGGGGAGFGTANNQAFYTGFGGSSHYAGNVIPASGATNGTTGANYGGGGSGGTSISASNTSGGNGAPGICIVTEYLT